MPTVLSILSIETWRILKPPVASLRDLEAQALAAAKMWGEHPFRRHASYQSRTAVELCAAAPSGNVGSVVGLGDGGAMAVGMNESR